MTYSEDDLDLFAIVRDKQDLDGTAYFELHPGEVPEPIDFWLEGSIFIRDAGFDFVVHCFSRANPKFDYFASERFSSAHLDALSLELNAFLQTLQPGCPRDAVFATYESIWSRDIWKEVGTEPLRDAVSRMTAGIRDFVERSREERRPLWVLGM